MYVRLDKIKATAHIESIVCDTELVNGQFLALGERQLDGEATKVTASGDVAEQLVLHASVPLVYGERENELDFKLKAGKVGRGFVLETGDVISIPKKSLVKGDVVVPSANGFVKGTAEGLHGKVILIENDAIVGQVAVIRVQA